MTTNKPKVQGYINEETFNAFLKWSGEQNIKSTSFALDLALSKLMVIDGYLPEDYTLTNQDVLISILPGDMSRYATLEEVERLANLIEDVRADFSRIKQELVNDKSVEKNEKMKYIAEVKPPKLEQELTDAQLAKILNKSPSTINRWRTGKRKAPPEVLEQWEAKNGRWYRKND